MRKVFMYGIVVLVMVIASMLMVVSQNIDYSFPNDPWIDRVLSLNQSGYNQTADVFLGDVEIDTIDSSFYRYLQDWVDTTQSAGMISGGVITGDNTAGTINVSAGTGFIKTTDSEIGNSVFVNWSCSDNIDMTRDNNTRHKIYVDYNNGTPFVNVTTGAIDYNTQFTLGSALYEVKTNTTGGTHTHLHILNEAGTRVYNLARRVQRALREPGFNRASGAVIGSRGLNITFTNGVFYGGINRLTTSAYDSDTTPFEYFFYNGSEWIQGYNSLINNSHYNDITSGLSELTPNRFGVHWVYLEVEGDVSVLYGQGDYTLTNAQASQPPSSIPVHLTGYGILAGRIIVKKGDITTTETSSAFDVSFTISAASDHAGLSNLDYASAGHTGFMSSDGTVPMTADWDIGNHDLNLTGDFIIDGTVYVDNIVVPGTGSVVTGELQAHSNIYGGGTIHTTGYGDNLWIGSVSIGIANFSANTGGDLNMSGELNVGGTVGNSTHRYTWTELNSSIDTQLTEDQVEAYIFDDDNTANLNMSDYNITTVDCIYFISGGRICSS